MKNGKPFNKKRQAVRWSKFDDQKVFFYLPPDCFTDMNNLLHNQPPYYKNGARLYGHMEGVRSSWT